MNKDKVLISVKMLNGFQCVVDGEALDIAGQINTKLGQFFVYLLYNYPEAVSQKNVFEEFYSDSDGDITNNFKALLFRLRKTLSEELQIPRDECILLKGGMLRFSDRIEVQSDVHDFRESYMKAVDAQDLNEKKAALEKFTNIYHGELLPSMSTALWVIYENAVLGERYRKAVNSLGHIYEENGENDKLYQLYKRGLLYFPYEEDWMIGAIESLVRLGKYKQATVEYEEMTGVIFDEMGVYPSEKLLDTMRLIQEKLETTVKSPESLSDAVGEDDIKGAYYCSYPNFINTYHILERIMDRDSIESVMILLTAVDASGVPLKDSDDIVSAMTVLRWAVSCALRKNDMYTRYSRPCFLILLWKAGRENIASIVERINKIVENEYEGVLKWSIKCEILKKGAAPPPAFETQVSM